MSETMMQVTTELAERIAEASGVETAVQEAAPSAVPVPVSEPASEPLVEAVDAQPTLPLPGTRWRLTLQEHGTASFEATILVAAAKRASGEILVVWQDDDGLIGTDLLAGFLKNATPLDGSAGARETDWIEVPLEIAPDWIMAYANLVRHDGQANAASGLRQRIRAVISTAPTAQMDGRRFPKAKRTFVPACPTTEWVIELANRTGTPIRAAREEILRVLESLPQNLRTTAKVA